MTEATPPSGEASTPPGPSGAGMLATAAFTRQTTVTDPPAPAEAAEKPAAFSLKAPIPISRTTMGTGVGRPIQSFRKGPGSAASLPPPLPETIMPPERPIPMEDVVRPVMASAPAAPPVAPPGGAHAAPATPPAPLPPDPLPAAPLPAPPPAVPAEPPPGRFASPSVPVTASAAPGALLPPPAPARDAPSAVAPPPATAATRAPAGVTAPTSRYAQVPPTAPAAAYSTFAPTPSTPVDDPQGFYTPLRTKEQDRVEPTREIEQIIANGGRAAPPRRQTTLLLTTLVLAAAAAGGLLLTRGGGSSTPTIKTTYAEATGQDPVDVAVRAEATTGSPYVLTLPPGWNATSRLVGAAAHHLDVTLARPVVGIEGTIASTRTVTAPDPKAGLPTGVADVRPFTQTIAGAVAHGVRFTMSGTRQEVLVLDRKGVAYRLAVRAPLASTRELDQDLPTLLKGWAFGP